MGYCHHQVKKVVNDFDRTILLEKENDRKKIVTGSLYLIAGLAN